MTMPDQRPTDADPEVSVRRAGPQDAATVARLLFEFNVEFDQPEPTAAEFEPRFRALLERTDVIVELAERSGGADSSASAAAMTSAAAMSSEVAMGNQAEAVGFAYLTLRPTPYYDGSLAQLEELYVIPALRDRGIGTKLLDRASAEVAEAGAAEIHINVDEDDVDTRQFYDHHGFVNIEPGSEFRMLCYIKEL